MDSFIREIDFYYGGMRYNEANILDNDKVIAALKKEKSELRQQIQKAEELAANEDPILRFDKVITALKKENRELRQQAKIGNFFMRLFMLGMLCQLVHDTWKQLKNYFT